MIRISLILLAVLIAASLITMSQSGNGKKTLATGNGSPSISITQVRQLAEIHVTRIPVQQILPCKMKGITGSIEMLMVMHGRIQMGINLERVELVDVDHSHKTAVVVLEPPRVLSAELDSQKLELYAIQRHGLWRLLPGSQLETELFNQALRQAHRSLSQYQSHPSIAVIAKQNAEYAIDRLGDAIGWRIEVRWRS